MIHRAFRQAVVAAALWALAAPALALTCLSNSNGAWNVAGTWTTCGGGVPGAGDTVQIRNGHDITIPSGYAAAASGVTFLANNNTGRLIHAAATSTLTVGAGGVTINAPINNNVNSWEINAGSATVNGSVTLVEGGNNSRISRINLTTGSLTVNGNVSMTNANADPRTQIVATGAATINITGNLSLSSLYGTLTPGTSTVNFTSGSTASVATGAAISYYNLTINKPGGTANASTNGALAVGGTLQVTAGTFNIPGINITVTGTTGVTGTLALTSATGTKIFAGAVTVNPGGTWNNSGNAAVTLRGGITSNGTFTSGTGAYTFDTTAGQQINAASSITFSGGVIVNATVTNNTTCTIAGSLTGVSTFSNAANAMLKIGGSLTSGLNASAAGNTVEYSATSPQIVRLSSYHNLTISASAAVTLEGSISIAGNLSNNGNLDAITGGGRVITFNGTTNQSLLGSATLTTMERVVINNTAADPYITINHDLKVDNLLTFTNGRIVTAGTTKVIGQTPSADGSSDWIQGAGAGKFVAGRLQRRIPNGQPVVTFHIGSNSAGGYSPVRLDVSSNGTGGDMMAWVTLGDHPNIGTSTLDATRSVNRYWTMTTSGVFGTPINEAVDLRVYGATFSYPNTGAVDVDTIANPLNFEAERLSQGTWLSTTPGTRTTTSTQVTVTVAAGLPGLGEFAIAEKGAGGSAGGGFNAFETVTPIGQTAGVLKTKIAGQSFSFDIVSLKSDGSLDSNYNRTVLVELLDASDNSGALDSDDCRSTWTTVIATLSPNPQFPSASRITVGPFTVANAWKNVRVRVTNTSGTTRRGCSGDNFAIRPKEFASFSVSDADWQTAGIGRALGAVSFATPTHKAGRPFSVRANAVNAALTPAITTNYVDTPGVSLSACTGAACTTSFGTLTLGAAFSSGQLLTDAATYSEVGSFQVKLVDTAFAAVDASDGSTYAERAIESAAIDVGRFVPDHFAVSLNTPSFGTACSAGSFTYVGQPFTYSVAPVITVTARNFATATTTLYTGAWYRISDASLTGLAYTAAAGTLDLGVRPSPDPARADSGAGVSTLTFGAGTPGIAFLRTTPVAPFDADISLAINVIDQDGVAYASNPARFGAATAGNGIAFTGGKQMRFGRLRLANAVGSEKLALPIPMRLEYWNGTAFVTNTADSCTSLARANITLSNYQAPLAACNTALGSSSFTFASGLATPSLSAPGAGKNGAVDLRVNLGTASGNYCAASPGAEAASTTAGKTWLRDQRNTDDNDADAATPYDDDPTARAAFGLYGGRPRNFIYFRENY